MFYRTALRPILFARDAERAHEMAIDMLAAAGRCPGSTRVRAVTHPRLKVTVAGISFPNPVGLAAGCDKNAEAVLAWPRFGFGFVEVGTVTAEPQPGNPRPRMFRLPDEHALINRLGFNSEGSEAVAHRLARLDRAHPHPAAPLGVNIGKTRRITGDREVLDDYRTSFRRLSRYASYVAVNVSSPNTPGLRQWQERDRLKRLLEALISESAALSIKRGAAEAPIFIKISPDMSDDDMADVVEVARELSIGGIIATNTTIRREGATARHKETGGLSGEPLKDRALEVIKWLYRHSGGKIPLIGVGGISSAQDAYDRIRAGASLVQVYSGLVYQGPFLPRSINSGLLRLMDRDGITAVTDLVGRGA